MIRGFVTNTSSPRAARDQDLAQANLLNHLYTRKRSRVFMPEFGFVIWDLFMDLANTNTRQIIQDDLIQIVSLYPYYQLQDLSIDEFEHGYNIAMQLIYLPLSSPVVLSLTFDQRTVI